MIIYKCEGFKGCPNEGCGCGFSQDNDSTIGYTRNVNCKVSISKIKENMIYRREKKMNDENESIDVDSLSWGSASKDVVRKVYGNLDKQPSVMAMKIEIANVEAEFALGKITRDEVFSSIEKIKKWCMEGETK